MPRLAVVVTCLMISVPLRSVVHARLSYMLRKKWPLRSMYSQPLIWLLRALELP